MPVRAAWGLPHSGSVCCENAFENKRRSDEGASLGSERGIYAYDTAQGTRFYFKYRSANGRSATKRGFTSQRAERRAREQMIVAVSRGEVALPSRETFGELYARWLRER